MWELQPQYLVSYYSKNVFGSQTHNHCLELTCFSHAMFFIPPFGLQKYLNLDTSMTWALRESLDACLSFLMSIWSGTGLFSCTIYLKSHFVTFCCYTWEIQLRTGFSGPSTVEFCILPKMKFPQPFWSRFSPIPCCRSWLWSFAFNWASLRAGPSILESIKTLWKCSHCCWVKQHFPCCPGSGH